MRKPAFILLLLFCFNIVSLAAKPFRVVSLVPSQTELLFELGYGKQIVGVSDYCNFPGETSEISKIGGLDLNVEKIMSLQPNLVLDLNSMHRKYQLLFTQLGLNYVNFNVKKLQDIPEMAARIASILGDNVRVSAFQEAWESKMSQLAANDSSKSFRVYLEIWDAPMQAAGPLSFMGEMVKTCGGSNIVTEASDYPVMNSEQIIAADPEIILVAYPHPDLESIKKRPGWSSISAIKNKKVFAVDQDLFVRPGPRNLEAMSILQQLFKSNK